MGEFNQDLKYNVIFIEEPGYKKNIDYRRIKSHRVFADNLKKYLVNKSYDLVYFEIPPNNMARVAVDYAEKMGIPCIADVNDLWPEAMKMILDIPLISDILFYPLKKMRRMYIKGSPVLLGHLKNMQTGHINITAAAFRRK